MTAQKWVRSSLRTLSAKLEAAGHVVSPPTVGRLLRKLDYSLHVNAKKVEASSNHPDRGRQFDYIAVQRATFTAAGLPIISTDSKKKARGRLQERWPDLVARADRRQRARLSPRRPRTGRAVRRVRHHEQPRLHLCWHLLDTPAFAADAIAAWWQTEGRAGSRLAPIISWCWQTPVAAMGAVSVLGKNVSKYKFAIDSASP